MFLGHILRDLEGLTSEQGQQIRETLETMVDACAERGFKWVGISDHSVTAAYAGGMKPDDVHRQFDEIEALNSKRRGIRVFKGIEVDILADGSVDYDEAIWEAYQVFGQPVTFVVSAGGAVVDSWSGLREESDIRSVLDQLAGTST